MVLVEAAKVPHEPKTKLALETESYRDKKEDTILHPVPTQPPEWKDGRPR